LQNAQRNLVHYVHWEYQLQQNLNADIYSGFMMSPTPFNGGNNNTNYFNMDGWNEWILNIAYDGVMQATARLCKKTARVIQLPTCLMQMRWQKC